MLSPLFNALIFLSENSMLNASHTSFAISETAEYPGLDLLFDIIILLDLIFPVENKNSTKIITFILLY